MGHCFSVHREKETQQLSAVGSSSVPDQQEQRVCLLKSRFVTFPHQDLPQDPTGEDHLGSEDGLDFTSSSGSGKHPQLCH